MSSANVKDYYYILGLARNASKEEIKKAHRKLSIKFHPDQNNGDKFFEDRFKDIQEAYETLIDDSKRKIYDSRLNQETGPSAAPSPPPNAHAKKRSGNKVYAVVGVLILLAPLVKLAVNKINEADQEKNSNLQVRDTSLRVTPHDTAAPPPSLLKVSYDTVATPPLPPGIDTGNNVGNSLTGGDLDVLPAVKDDDSLTAEDAVTYFFNAFNNGDCDKAWNMTYNGYWAQQGENWFCSANAFGDVRKVIVKNISISVQEASQAQVHVNYYAEDSYNGNKCFNQSIIVQKIEFTDGKFRWRITKMINLEDPVACSGY